MKKLLASLCCSLCGACSASAITCPAGSTVYTSIPAGGNASVAATWGGTAIASSGNGACLVVTGPVAIDLATLGTSGGTGLMDVITSGAGSISFSTGTHSVYFGSTGADPCGSGTSAAPGASATMHGFFLPVGNNQIVSSTNGIYINSADGVHPWYIAKTDAAGTPSITVRGAHMLNLGASATCGDTYGTFQGISALDSGSGTISLDVENNWFDGYYAAVAALGSANRELSVTSKNNLRTGRTGPASLWSQGQLNAVVTQNDTEYSPAASGFMEQWGGGMASYSTSGNFGAGAPGYAIAAIQMIYPPAGFTVPGWMIYNDPGQAGYGTLFSQCFYAIGAASVSGVYAENCNQTAVFSGTFSASVAITNHLAASGQGTVFWAGGSLTVHHLLCVYTDTTSVVNTCLFPYGSGTTVVAYNNTMVQLVPNAANVNTQGILLGDGLSAPLSNNYLHHNLTTGFYFSILDSVTGSPDTFLTSCAGGVGVCNNATNTTGAPYTYTVKPTNWDNGSNAHPNSVYGDVNGIDPAFIDPTRISLASYDLRVLGGPGTIADFQTQIGRRAGWGSTYTLGSAPIANVIAWVQGGFTPGDSRMCPGGVTIGAVACVTAATAIIP